MSDEVEPSLPPPPPPIGSEAASADAGDGSPREEENRHANALPRRTIAAVVALMFALGSCGVAYGVFRVGEDGGPGGGGGRRNGGTDVEPPASGTSEGPNANRSPKPGEAGARSPKGPDADLVVSRLTGTEVDVENVGAGHARSFVVAVADLTFTVEAGLRSGARATLEYRCVRGPLDAIADVTDRVDESDENNNERSAGPFECKKPDAAPSDPPPSNDPSPGDPNERPDLIVRSLARDRVVVANVGDGAAGDFVVDVGRAGTFDVGRLDVGETKTFRFACARRPSVRVDAGDDVRETNEDNNRKVGGPFLCLADLVVSEIGAHSVTIQNIGTGGAGGSVVQVDGERFQVPPIAPGGRAQIAYPCVGGFVNVTADVNDQVVESSESNNRASGQVGACLTSAAAGGSSVAWLAERWRVV